MVTFSEEFHVQLCRSCWRRVATQLIHVDFELPTPEVSSKNGYRMRGYYCDECCADALITLGKFLRVRSRIRKKEEPIPPTISK